MGPSPSWALGGESAGPTGIGSKIVAGRERRIQMLKENLPSFPAV